jgi:inorganic phosphate transporter, PiT family
VASPRGWPVSTTHTIVGAIVGFAAVGIGLGAVQWNKVGTIAMSWVISPVLAGIISYWLFVSVQRLILNAEQPLEAAKRYVPYYMFLVGFIISPGHPVQGPQACGPGTLQAHESYLMPSPSAWPPC